MSRNELKTKSDAIKRIVIWCIERQGRCFKGWEASKIFKFIAWHWLAGNVFVNDKACTISAIAVAWRRSPEAILELDRQKLPVFDWQPFESGDALYISHLFGDRANCAALWADCLKKWPSINRVFVHRNDVLKEIPINEIRRFCHV